MRTDAAIRTGILLALRVTSPGMLGGAEKNRLLHLPAWEKFARQLVALQLGVSRECLERAFLLGPPALAIALRGCFERLCTLGLSPTLGSKGAARLRNRIPLPSLALLTQHPEPGCELKASELNGHKGRAEGVPVRVANLPGERSYKSAG